MKHNPFFSSFLFCLFYFKFVSSVLLLLDCSVCSQGTGRWLWFGVKCMAESLLFLVSLAHLLLGSLLSLTEQCTSSVFMIVLIFFFVYVCVCVWMGGWVGVHVCLCGCVCVCGICI